MNLKEQQGLVAVHRQLAAALRTPSHTCKHCKELTAKLATVTAIYSDVLEGVIKGQVRREFARRVLSTVLDVVKAFTRS